MTNIHQKTKEETLPLPLPVLLTREPRKSYNNNPHLKDNRYSPPPNDEVVSHTASLLNSLTTCRKAIWMLIHLLFSTWGWGFLLRGYFYKFLETENAYTLETRSVTADKVLAECQEQGVWCTLSTASSRHLCNPVTKFDTAPSCSGLLAGILKASFSMQMQHSDENWAASCTSRSQNVF